MPGESLPDTATGYACKDGPTGLQPMLEYSRDVKDPKGGQPHPLRIHHADELRHCLPQTCGCCPWHAEALPRALWEAGGTRVLWVPLSPHNYPGQTLLCPQVPGCRGDGDHGGQQVPCPLCPVVTPGMGPFPTVGPAGRGGQGVGTRPAPPCFPHQSETRELLPRPQPITAQHPSSSQPIRGGGGAGGGMAASPPANRRPAAAAGGWGGLGGAGHHGGCGTWLGLGEGLQVQGCAVGARCQDVGDILPQESGPVDTPGLLLLCGWQDLLRALAVPAAGRAAL